MDVQIVYSPAPGPASSPVMKNTAITTVGSGTTLNPSVGASVVTDEIIAIFCCRTPGTVTPPSNFTLVVSDGVAGFCGQVFVYKWDGTGTRPNSSTIAFSWTSSDAAQCRTLVISGANGTGNTAALGIGTTSTTGFDVGPITAAANSLVISAYNVSNARDITFNAPSGLPTSDTLPDTKSFWNDDFQADDRADIVAFEAGAGGSITMDTTMSGVAYCNAVLFEVLAA